ncbi:MAG TPA: RcnB family protein [Allosphingosinicella sp.]|nr:RcnB family protein [Allosphingosinicella sp.]
MRTLSLSVLAASIALIPSGAFAQTMPPPGYGPQMAPQMAPMMPSPNLPRRLERGWTVNPYWMGPQFTISNWQSYGFADPGTGRHWIRYYDDAYLVDQSGRVIDARGGLDWDQYGEQWDMVNGIPAYRGSRAWQPGAQDYASASAGSYQTGTYQTGGYQAGGYQYGYPVGAPMPAPMPGPMPATGYGYQVYGGYGYYPVVIYQIGGAAAASGAAYSEEIIEEYVEQAQAQRRRPAARRAPVRRPPPGERG